MQRLEFHPASEVFRLLEGKELQAICDSIEKYDQQVSIKILDGKILDGRNRYLACLKLKKEPWLEHVTKADLDGMSPLDYVVAMNRDRRHDSEGEKQISAGKIKLAYEAEAAERQKTGTLAPIGAKVGKAAELASEATGVPTRTVERAAKVVKHGAPELVEAVSEGTAAVADAAAVATAPKPAQRKAVKQVKSGKAKTLKAALEPHERGGKQKNDPRVFERLKTQIGAVRRAVDDLNRNSPAFKFHRDTVSHLNGATSCLDDWRKAVR